MATGSPSDVAELVVRLATGRPPTLGTGRLVCIDGPAGSGKTTLAAAVAVLTGAQVVHVDDLLQGWEGLHDTGPQLESVVRPLQRGEPGSYRHFDWAEDRFTHAVPVPPAPWLVLEGVGVGNPVIADAVTVLVWVEVDDVRRLARGLERDGAEMESRWRQWMDDEVELFARHGTAGRAHVLVDGTGATPPVLE